MTTEIGFPFVSVRISGPANAANAATLVDAGSNLKGSSITGQNITIAGLNIPTSDITDDVRYFRRTDTAAQVNLRNVASRTVPRRRGPVTTDLVLTCYYDYSANSAYNEIVKEPEGVKVIRVERHSGESLTAVVELVTLEEPDQPADDGQSLFVATFANVANSGEPVWE